MLLGQLQGSLQGSAGAVGIAAVLAAVRQLQQGGQPLVVPLGWEALEGLLQQGHGLEVAEPGLGQQDLGAQLGPGLECGPGQRLLCTGALEIADAAQGPHGEETRPGSQQRGPPLVAVLRQLPEEGAGVGAAPLQQQLAQVELGAELQLRLGPLGELLGELAAQRGGALETVAQQGQRLEGLDELERGGGGGGHQPSSQVAVSPSRHASRARTMRSRRRSSSSLAWRSWGGKGATTCWWASPSTRWAASSSRAAARNAR